MPGGQRTIDKSKQSLSSYDQQILANGPPPSGNGPDHAQGGAQPPPQPQWGGQQGGYASRGTQYQQGYQQNGYGTQPTMQTQYSYPQQQQQQGYGGQYSGGY